MLLDSLEEVTTIKNINIASKPLRSTEVHDGRQRRVLNWMFELNL